MKSYTFLIFLCFLPAFAGCSHSRYSGYGQPGVIMDTCEEADTSSNVPLSLAINSIPAASRVFCGHWNSIGFEGFEGEIKQLCNQLGDANIGRVRSAPRACIVEILVSNLLQRGTLFCGTLSNSQEISYVKAVISEEPRWAFGSYVYSVSMTVEGGEECRQHRSVHNTLVGLTNLLASEKASYTRSQVEELFSKAAEAIKSRRMPSDKIDGRCLLYMHLDGDE